MTYRILVTGSRDWTNHLTIYRALTSVCDQQGLNHTPDEYGNTMPDPTRVTVVTGACPTGADAMASDWCLNSFFLPEEHPAEWDTYGKAAGFRRNAEMVELGADMCLAFIRDESKGATHTATLAAKAGIVVGVFREAS